MFARKLGTVLLAAALLAPLLFAAENKDRSRADPEFDDSLSADHAEPR